MERGFADKIPFKEWHNDYSSLRQTRLLCSLLTGAVESFTQYRPPSPVVAPLNQRFGSPSANACMVAKWRQKVTRFTCFKEGARPGGREGCVSVSRGEGNQRVAARPR